YHDPAANTVAVTLGHNVAHDGWAVRRDLDGPRQSCTIDALRVRVHIKIADVRHRSHRTEDLIYDRFLGELPDVGDFGFAVRRMLVQIGNGTDPRHREPRGADDRQHHQRYPCPPQH